MIHASTRTNDPNWTISCKALVIIGCKSLIYTILKKAEDLNIPEEVWAHIDINVCKSRIKGIIFINFSLRF